MNPRPKPGGEIGFFPGLPVLARPWPSGPSFVLAVFIFWVYFPVMQRFFYKFIAGFFVVGAIFLVFLFWVSRHPSAEAGGMPQAYAPGTANPATTSQGDPAYSNDGNGDSLSFNFDELPTKASGEKQALLIFSATWCAPCKEMKAKVYSTAEVQGTRSQFEWVHLDVDTPEGKREAGRLNISGVPTFIVVDQDGEEIRRASGGMSKSEFVSFLNK